MDCIFIIQNSKCVNIKALDICELGSCGNHIKGSGVEVSNNVEVFYVFKASSESQKKNLKSGRNPVRKKWPHTDTLYEFVVMDILCWVPSPHLNVADRNFVKVRE